MSGFFKRGDLGILRRVRCALQPKVGEEAEEAERDCQPADDQWVADREVGQLQRTASDAFVT